MQRHTGLVQRRLMEAEALNAVLALCGSHIKQPQGAAPLNALRVSALKPHAVKPKSDCQKDHSLHPCCCTPARAIQVLFALRSSLRNRRLGCILVVLTISGLWKTFSKKLEDTIGKWLKEYKAHWQLQLQKEHWLSRLSQLERFCLSFQQAKVLMRRRPSSRRLVPPPVLKKLPSWEEDLDEVESWEEEGLVDKVEADITGSTDNFPGG